MSEIIRVPIFDRSIQDYIEVDLIHGVTYQQISDAHIEWQAAMRTLLQQLREAGVPWESWPEHAHWNWQLKAIMAEAEGDHIFGIYHEFQMQGLMILKSKAHSKLDESENLVYVDYLAAAPWNLDIAGVQIGRMKQIGRVFLAAAIRYSDVNGCDGRIGLYSLPQAVRWYQNQGMVELPQSALTNGLRYFEMTPEAAKQF